MIGLVEPLAVRPPGFAVTVYFEIGEPPSLLDAVKETVASPSPAVTEPMVGLVGASAVTAKLCTTAVAAVKALLPAWLASILQVPVDANETAPALVTVQTPLVCEEKLTGRPESAVAVSERELP